MSYFVTWVGKKELEERERRFKGGADLEDLRFEMTENVKMDDYIIPQLATSEKRLGKKAKKIRKKNRKRYYEMKKRRK